MSEVLPIWPSVFPAPSNNYKVVRVPQVIRSQMDTGLTRTRKRFSINIKTVDLTWEMTDEEFGYFEAWMENYGVSDGAAWFYMDLALGDEMQQTKVRLIGSFSSDWSSAGFYWNVSAKLEVYDVYAVPPDAIELLLDPVFMAEFIANLEPAIADFDNFMLTTFPANVSQFQRKLQINPCRISADSITGTDKVDATKVSVDGLWFGRSSHTPRDSSNGRFSDIALTYQWQRFTGGVWVDIANAIKRIYTVVAADLGLTLRLKTTGTNKAGQQTVYTSAATAAIAASGSVGAAPTTGTWVQNSLIVRLFRLIWNRSTPGTVTHYKVYWSLSTQTFANATLCDIVTSSGSTQQGFDYYGYEGPVNTNIKFYLVANHSTNGDGAAVATGNVFVPAAFNNGYQS